MIIDDYKFPKSDIIFYLYNVFRYKKWKFFYKIFHRHIRRPWSRSILHKFQPPGIGLEIGCGSSTIAPVRNTILSDAYVEHAGENSLAKVFFDTTRIPYCDNSFSFILSEHVLEHIYDPIQVFFEWNRVLKIGGRIFLFLPHPDRTFDRYRRKTSLEELKKRSYTDSISQKKNILQDWLDNVINKGFANHYQRFTGVEMLQKGLIHYNVWTPETMVALIEDIGLKIVDFYDVVPDRKDSFLVICEKVEKSCES